MFTAAEDDEIGPDGKRIRPGISASIISELTNCNAALSQQRKKRQVMTDDFLLQMLHENSTGTLLFHGWHLILKILSFNFPCVIEGVSTPIFGISAYGLIFFLFPCIFRYLQRWLPLMLWRDTHSSIVIHFTKPTNLVYYLWTCSIQRYAHSPTIMVFCFMFHFL